MSIALPVTAGALALALWIVTMYSWWQQESGKTPQPATAQALSYYEACARLTRRGWYACALYVRSIGHWGNQKMQKVFFALFPGAEPAFAKRDALTGLKHGPTSYFLRSISEKEPVVVKKTARKIFS